MKNTNLSSLLVLGLVLTISNVGCRHNPVNVTQIPDRKGGPIPDPNASLMAGGPRVGQGDPTSGIGKEGPTGGIPLTGDFTGWTPDNESLRQQTLYFDYDKTAIRSGEQPKLEMVANYLKDHPDVGLRIDGHCDERGTEEYNRSLGERRSLAAREFLVVSLGIDPKRINSNTWGEDRPADPAHSDAAWSKNRRDEFVVLLRPKP